MSTDLIDSRITRLNSLCKHYVIVLSKKREEAERIAQAMASAKRENANDPKIADAQFASAKLVALREGFARLKPALGQLIRTASQTVEHATRDDLDRLELTVLLADLEANLEQTDWLLDRLNELDI